MRSPQTVREAVGAWQAWRTGNSFQRGTQPLALNNQRPRRHAGQRMQSGNFAGFDKIRIVK